eukprot:gene3516-9114_t
MSFLVTPDGLVAELRGASGLGDRAARRRLHDACWDISRAAEWLLASAGVAAAARRRLPALVCDSRVCDALGA